MAPDNTVRFAGGLLDTDSGLYDLRARMYGPADGRFQSPDPLPSSVRQPYIASYVNGFDSPVASTDPSGLGAVWAYNSAQGLLEKVRSLLARLKDGFSCSTSILIPLTLAIASPAIAAAWLTGYMLACRSLNWRRLPLAIWETHDAVLIGFLTVAVGSLCIEGAGLTGGALAAVCGPPIIAGVSSTGFMYWNAMRAWGEVFADN